MDFVFVPVSCRIKEEEPNELVHMPERIASFSLAILNAAEKAKELFKIQVDTLPCEEGSFSNEKLLACLALSGPLKQVEAAQLWLSIKLLRKEIASIGCNAFTLCQDGTFLVKATVKDRLYAITESSGAELKIRFTDSPLYSPPFVSINGPADTFIDIIGSYEQIQRAKTQILSFLGELSGLVVKPVTIKRSLIPIVFGRGRNVAVNMMTNSGVSLIIPDLCPSISALVDARLEDEELNVYVLSKDPETVNAQVYEIQNLTQLKVVAVKKKIVSTNLSSFLFVLKEKHKNLNDILIVNGVSLTFTSLDLKSNVPQDIEIVFQGEYDICLENAVKQFVDICTKFFVMTKTLSSSLVSELSKQNISKAAFIKRFGKMVQKTGAEISVCGNTINVSGSAESIIDGSKLVKEVEDLQHLIRDISFKIVLDPSYKEFITGKKNGKLNKIIKACGVSINFDESIEAYLILIVSSGSFVKALDGFEQLRDELPAELEFYVSDAHHKRIIGVAGKNIQSIMKVYGVYVKFISADEFESIGGMFWFDKNVLARTPAKNSFNLRNLHHALLDSIDSSDREQAESLLEVNRFFHSGIYKDWVNIEKSSSSVLEFPDLSGGSQIIKLQGSERNTERAKELIMKEFEVKSCVLFSAECDDISKMQTFGSLMKIFEKLGFKQIYEVTDAADFKCLNLVSSQSSLINNSQKIKTEFVTFSKGNSFSVPNGNKPLSELVYFHESCERNADEKQDTIFFQSLSTFNENQPAVLKGESFYAKFAGSAPNLRSLVNDGKKQQVPIGMSPRSSIGSNKSFKQEGLSSAVDQITSGMPASLTLSHQPGSSALPNTASVNKKNGNNSSYRRATFHTGYIPEHLASDTNSFSSDSELNQISDLETLDNLPLQSPNDVDKSRHIIPSKTYTEEIVSDANIMVVQESGVSAGSDQELISSVIKNVQSTEFNNKLDLLLESLDLEKYKQTFLDNDVDFEMFLKLKEEDFKELGISLGARKKMVQAIEETNVRRDQEKPKVPRISTNPPKAAPGLPIISAPVSPAAWYNNNGDWSQSLDNAPPFMFQMNGFPAVGGITRSKPSSPTTSGHLRLSQSNAPSINAPEFIPSNKTANAISPIKFSGFAPALVSPLSGRGFFSPGIALPKTNSFSGGDIKQIRTQFQKSFTEDSSIDRADKTRPRINTDPSHYSHTNLEDNNNQ